MSLRRAGAPRLIEWTGERCVPWAPDVQVVYEHYHRYLWARELAKGRRVLDLGSGEGFGAALLAEVAQSVHGIDIDARTVEHARLNYGGGSLSFEVASATDLSSLEDDAVDLVVAFEVIEHVAEQEEVLAEVRRVLAPNGVLAISTPERVAYAEASDTPNPFHERELSEAELRSLLGDSFASLRLFSQRTMTGSRIEGADGGRSSAHLGLTIQQTGDVWEEAAGPAPLYLIAVASDADLPELPDDSTLSDFGIALKREAERDAADARGELTRVRAELEQRAAAAEAELEQQRVAAEAERDAADARGELMRVRAELEQRAAAEAAAADRRELIAAASIHSRDAELRWQELEHLHQRLGHIDQSIAWRLLQRVRMRVYGLLGGRDSLPGRTLSAALRHAGSSDEYVAEKRRWTGSFPELSRPDVSIVIPVHSGAELTKRCLQAIAASAGTVAFEVIVVDDLADSDTKALLRAVEGIRVLVNTRNEGFLHSTNRGAKEARGRHIVVLNNDTEPQAGWLDALVERAESAPDVGIVAAKLIYPDGTLQEAGGIVWRDGTPWNFGKGQQANEPQYNYVREVDYGSAAALLVRSELWQDAKGFDPRFAPSYFEDVDLCFTARALGRRVLYEPKAVVIHQEGGTMGTDVTLGGKRHQVLNQPKFAEKWSATLRDHPGNASLERAALASNHRRAPQVLVIDHRIPMSDRDAGSLRMHHILQRLLEQGCRVSFLPDDGCPHEPYAARLQGSGVELLCGSVDLPAYLASRAPRLTILSRPYVAARYLHTVRQHAPGSWIAYDTVDLHYVRERRRAEVADEADMAKADGLRELELAMARACDLTLTVSEAERQQLLSEEPELEIEVLPLCNELWTDVPPRAARSGVLLIGGFEHEPNVDAAIQLVREVMPLVWRELDDVPVTIVGAGAPPEVAALASDRVLIKGWVDDLRPFLAESIALVAPLRYGAGVKGKVTESMAAGLPVVTTSTGAEGLDVEPGEHLLIGDDAEQLARLIVDLYRDDALWCRLSEGGQDVVGRTCSPDAQRPVLERLVARPPRQPLRTTVTQAPDRPQRDRGLRLASSDGAGDAREM